MIRGVVIGKFYPPHRGHAYLIETAFSQVDQLFIIICGKKDETIPPQLRYTWLKEMYPKAQVMLIEDIYDPNDSELWARNTIQWLGFVPDIVFTSEDYGVAYAAFLGSKHVLVDKARKAFPISGTKVRENPYSSWEYLTPPVKAYFAKRICIVGAESTGTTTLAKDLANHYKTAWVPEFGRLYYEGRVPTKGSEKWTTQEFEFIAQEQNKVEDQLASVCNEILICDTDSFATTLWHTRYVGHKSKEVEKFARGRKYDLYILTDIDIPFVQDGTRDGEYIRSWMHEQFLIELTRWKKKYIIASGSRDERLKKAIQAVTL
jgi:HTH-type transcriptional regulator, transcriptional repressor of NAD biosynthesis genes